MENFCMYVCVYKHMFSKVSLGLIFPLKIGHYSRCTSSTLRLPIPYPSHERLSIEMIRPACNSNRHRDE